MKTMKMAYYGSKYLIWSLIASAIDDLFLTLMVAGTLGCILVFN